MTKGDQGNVHNQNDEQAAALRTLKAKMRRYRDSFALAPEGCLITDAHGNIEEANLAAAAMLNLSQQSLVSRSLIDFVTDGYGQALCSDLAQWPETEQVKEWDVRLLPREGVEAAVTLRAFPLRGDEGAIYGFHWTMFDATSYERAEESSHTSAENHERLIEQLTTERALLEAALRQIPSGIIIADASSGAPLLTNEHFEQLWGLNDSPSNDIREFRRGKGFHKDGHPYEADEWPLARTLDTGEAVMDEEIEIARDGTRKTVRVNSTPVRNRDGRVIAAVELTFDFTELTRAHEQIRERTVMLDESEDAIYVRDTKGRILFWNKGAERIFGWTAEEATGQDIRQLIFSSDPDKFDQVNADVLDKEGKAEELTLLTKSGREVIVEKKWSLMRDEAGNPKAVLSIMADITETKKIEAQLFRLQRLDSIGALAAGIAHDLGNTLAPILMTVQLLKKKVDDENGQRYLNMIQRNVRRSVELVKRVMGFVRGDEDERLALPLQHLIYEIDKMLKGTLPRSILLETSIQEDLWSVIGNATQIHQMVMNLCVNARDAMKAGGRMLIAAENVHLNETEAQVIGKAKPGRYVLIKVADTGTGIHPDIIGEIFTPFFTTKERSEGTGLGLATVATIVKDHSGFITTTSEVGRGTEFKIYLPATESVQATQLERKERSLPSGNGELILVADDEAAVREITKEVLDTYGYRALTASDGMETVTLYSQNKGQVRVVMTDLMMPYLDGPETIRALRKINPAVKVIAMSGTSSGIDFAESGTPLIDRFLQKPYTAEKLLEILADILAEE